MNQIIVISGPPGAGKTSVANALCERFDRMLHVEVDAKERRRGVGTKLFTLMRKEADLFFRSRGQRLRRIFCYAAHRDDIVFRGWLTKQGFHPTNTMTNVLKKQDVMIYLLGCD